MTNDGSLLDEVCFVISPIGREGTDQHERFREVLDFIIKPAVEATGFTMKVIRADEIDRAGSFIKDILEYIAGARIVIADLTGQNPNVFYELGVRHSLSSRTILIAQQLEDVPSDLREYRTIIYETSAKGAALFRERIIKYLREIQQDPERPDNPVLDRLGGLLSARTAELQGELASLRGQLESVLKEGTKDKPRPKSKGPDRESLWSRIPRVLKLLGITSRRFWVGAVSMTQRDGQRIAITLPAQMGEFTLHLKSGRSPAFLYLAEPINFQPEREVADMRVLLEDCSKSPAQEVEFVIAKPTFTEEEAAWLREAFDQIKTFVPEETRRRFTLELWDDARITKFEEDLGIRVGPIPPSTAK